MNPELTKQWTLQRPVKFAGVGLHSGERSMVRLLPASANHGLVFVRRDLPGLPNIPALAEYVSDTTLSTSLARGKTGVRTVEHLLAALYGMGISNARIEVQGAEIPAMDGSADAFARGLVTAGREVQPADRTVIVIPERFELGLGDRSLTCLPDTDPAVTYRVDYEHPYAGVQCWEGKIDPSVFRQELAPARTFCLLAEAQRMRDLGFACGGSFDNAVVVLDEGYSSQLRFADEFVRHKVLDLLGDLALSGAGWRGRVVAVRAGHSLHVRLATRFRQYLRASRLPLRAMRGAYAS